MHRARRASVRLFLLPALAPLGSLRSPGLPAGSHACGSLVLLQDNPEVPSAALPGPGPRAPQPGVPHPQYPARGKCAVSSQSADEAAQSSGAEPPTPGSCPNSVLFASLHRSLYPCPPWAGVDIGGPMLGPCPELHTALGLLACDVPPWSTVCQAPVCRGEGRGQARLTSRRSQWSPRGHPRGGNEGQHGGQVQSSSDPPKANRKWK